MKALNTSHWICNQSTCYTRGPLQIIRFVPTKEMARRRRICDEPICGFCGKRLSWYPKEGVRNTNIVWDGAFNVWRDLMGNMYKVEGECVPCGICQGVSRISESTQHYKIGRCDNCGHETHM